VKRVETIGKFTKTLGAKAERGQLEERDAAFVNFHLDR
jgi:hypothetical protein